MNAWWPFLKTLTKKCQLYFHLKVTFHSEIKLRLSASWVIAMWWLLFSTNQALHDDSQIPPLSLQNPCWAVSGAEDLQNMRRVMVPQKTWEAMCQWVLQVGSGSELPSLLASTQGTSPFSTRPFPANPSHFHSWNPLWRFSQPFCAQISFCCQKQ